MENPTQTLVHCKICQKGALMRKHVPMFGSAGTALRNLFVILGVLSLLVGIGLAVASPAAQADMSAVATRDPYISNGYEHDPAPADVNEVNNDAQTMQWAESYEKPALIIGAVLVVVGAFVGCRKWKLVCNSCGAAIDAA
jgi:hypothetical protein